MHSLRIGLAPWALAGIVAIGIVASPAQAQDMLSTLGISPEHGSPPSTEPDQGQPANPARAQVATIPADPAASVAIPPATRTAAAVPAAAEAPALGPAAPAAQPLAQPRLDQLVAPVALYPDPLLSQVLMASTYPLEVVEAARWTRVPANRSLSGDALTEALKPKNWDPSIMALVAFPRLLSLMADKLEWTEQLGDAFLAQQPDVMSTVQRLRHEALAAGNLKVTPQCHCVIQTSGEIISILPSAPQVVCVPVYNPRVAYGSWPEPAYPPVVFPAPADFAYQPGFAIGFGPVIELAAFGPLWGWDSIDWAHRHIAVDAARYARVGGGRGAFAGGVWVHDPAHRRGVAYADPAVTARFGAARVDAVTHAGRLAFAHPQAVGPHGGPRHDAVFAPGTIVRGPSHRGPGGFHGGPAGFHNGPAGFHGEPGRGPIGAAHFAAGPPHGGHPGGGRPGGPGDRR